MTAAGTVVVVGSVNLDLAVRVPRIAGPGETLLASSMSRSGGGKGANQAVAAARAGADTSFLGCVGDDDDGVRLRVALTTSGVRTDLLATVGAPTGTALISVDDRGENAIVVVPGANAVVRAPNPDQRARIAAADVLLAQLEIPQAAVIAAARARTPGTAFILNAAPSAPLPDELWSLIDILVVNQHEALDLCGTVAGHLERATTSLLERVPVVILTLGSAGAVLARRGAAPVTVPAPTVTAVDTTAAGDTFCGVVAAALACGQDLLEAVRLGSAAASLAVQRTGAQDSVPTQAETRAQRDVTYPPPGRAPQEARA
ncbi:ribokinase [Pengzhenrongella frigida]|uniref:Ribokinase n=1 Tax=Pengzhenrongella frigida TaxID=1259133 RepID=A0A4Q5N1W3_9MICO|nr:ribokinase [Cellulomonas sp. HLT2-17]RYV52128.1 ribokinase [Cellulomonas sp. HLT2-17]